MVLVTIALIFILDAVDGYVARRSHTTSVFGAVFDIAADRIIENVFWIYFAVNLMSHELFPDYLERIQTVTHVLAITAVTICLLRGVPVIIDGITHIQTARTHNTPTAKHHSSIKEM